jgi:hypothetical protein
MQISKNLGAILAAVSLSAAHPVDVDVDKRQQNPYGLCGIPGMALQSLTLGSATYYYVVPWDPKGYSAGSYYSLQTLMSTMEQDLVQCGATEEGMLNFQAAHIEADSHLSFLNQQLTIGIVGMVISGFNGLLGAVWGVP